MGWSSARAVHYAFALLTKVHTDVKQRFLKEIQNRILRIIIAWSLFYLNRFI